MKLHKELDKEEIEYFRKWTKENYQPFSNINGCWHPVIQIECARINQEANLKFKTKKDA